MRAALVRLGKVIQVVVLGPNWQNPSSPEHWTPPSNTVVVPTEDASIGWDWDGLTFVAPPANPEPPPTPEQLRAATFASLPDRQDIITRLRTATPAQIDAWLTANVTTLAQARTVLGALIKVFCINPPN